MTRVLSVLSLIQLAAHQLWLESASVCGSVLSVAELMVGKTLVSLANKKYLECLIELQRSLINTVNNRGPQTDSWRASESTCKGVKYYGFGQQNEYFSNYATNWYKASESP